MNEIFGGQTNGTAGWQTRPQTGPEKTEEEDFFREVDLLEVGYHPHAADAKCTQWLSPEIGASCLGKTVFPVYFRKKGTCNWKGPKRRFRGNTSPLQFTVNTKTPVRPAPVAVTPWEPVVPKITVQEACPPEFVRIGPADGMKLAAPSLVVNWIE